jgi:F-type H+-transporting ATPase subunit gamma
MDNVKALTLIDKILDFWRNGKAKQIIFVAPHYKNSFTFYPVLKTFLPFSKEMIESNIGHSGHVRRHGKSDPLTIYEPTREVLISRLHEQVIMSMFVESFLELKASEYSSRMMAMQSATDAADKVTAGLSLQYNKARQQEITREIAELVGASDAIGS